MKTSRKRTTVLLLCAATLSLCACEKEPVQSPSQEPLKILCHAGSPSLGFGLRDASNRFVWNLTAAYMEMEIDTRGLDPQDQVSLTFEPLGGTYREG